MTILLWWSLASVAVSVFVGAFLAFARHEPETFVIDLRPTGAERTDSSDLTPASPPS